MSPESESAARFVGIARDFLRACRALREVARCHAAGSLDFDRVQELVGDDRDSILFRLKEDCHELFRRPDGGVVREAVFDLAVGALFHEAMKFRENYYQQAIYAPKLRALEDAGDESARGLLEASREILEMGERRVSESLRELERLLDETTRQFYLLLDAHRDNALVARLLIERQPLVEAALGVTVDEVFERTWGSVGEAHALAARSYLDSGHFVEALGVLGSGRVEPSLRDRLRAYAEGMLAYLQSRHGDALEAIDRWVDVSNEAEIKRFASLAASALRWVASALRRAGDEDGARRADELVATLGSAAS